MVIEILQKISKKELSNGVVQHKVKAVDENGFDLFLYFHEDLKNLMDEEKIFCEKIKEGVQYNMNSYTVRRDGGLVFTFEDLANVTALRGQGVFYKETDGTFISQDSEKSTIFWKPENKELFTKFFSHEFNDFKILDSLEVGEEFTAKIRVVRKWENHPTREKRNGWTFIKPAFKLGEFRTIAGISTIEEFTPESGESDRDECPELYTESVGEWETEREEMRKAITTAKKRIGERKAVQQAREAREYEAKRQKAVKSAWSDFLKKNPNWED